MTVNEDREALAAEYVLGTLDADERARVELMLETDPPFATLVHAWEKKIGELHHTIEAVEPPAHVWRRIVARLDGEDAAPAAGGANVIDLTRRMRRWRSTAVATGALAASLMLFVAVKETAPHLLPGPLRPAERFVALLQENNGAPGFVMTVDLRSKSFSVRKVGGEAPAGRSYQMWFVHPTFAGGPRSLGVFTDRVPDISATLAQYPADIVNNATYAVSIEPLGGSPTGSPTGPVPFHGRLIELDR
jgi:anti-sigma-K factor RskA